MLKRLIPLLFLALALPHSGAAQGVWEAFPTSGAGGRGAGVCPVDDTASGDFFCLTLSCGPEAPLAFAIGVSGGALPERFDGIVEVDGSIAGVLELTRAANPDYLEYTAAFDKDRHLELVELLKGGLSGAITLVSPEDGRELASQGFSLRNSARSLEEVMRVCPLPRERARNPLKVLAKQARLDCAELGGQVIVEPEALSQPDLNMDGRPDQVIDLGALGCSEAAGLYCGSGGCGVSAWLAQPDGSYVELFNKVLRDYAVSGPAGRRVLTLSLHGSACGRAGYEECFKSYRIEGNDLIPLQ